MVPLPGVSPYIEVGRDYFGESVGNSPEYRALEEAIVGPHARFDPGLPLEREFPGGLIFSFLESFVARLTLAREEFLAGRIGRRAVADRLGPSGPGGHGRGGVLPGRVPPDDRGWAAPGLHRRSGRAGDRGRRRALHGIVSAVIPGAASAYGRARVSGYTPPESVLIARKVCGRINRQLHVMALGITQRSRH